MSGKKVRVLIAADHGTVREAMKLLAVKETGTEVVGLAAEGRQALRPARDGCGPHSQRPITDAVHGLPADNP